MIDNLVVNKPLQPKMTQHDVSTPLGIIPRPKSSCYSHARNGSHQAKSCLCFRNRAQLWPRRCTEAWFRSDSRQSRCSGAEPDRLSASVWASRSFERLQDSLTFVLCISSSLGLGKTLGRVLKEAKYGGIVGNDFAGVVEELGPDVPEGARTVGERIAGAIRGSKFSLRTCP